MYAVKAIVRIDSKAVKSGKEVSKVFEGEDQLKVENSAWRWIKTRLDMLDDFQIGAIGQIERKTGETK